MANEYILLKEIYGIRIMKSKTTNQDDSNEIILIGENNEILGTYNCDTLYHNKKDRKLLISEGNNVSIYDFETKSFIINKWEIVKKYINDDVTKEAPLIGPPCDNVFVLKDPENESLHVLSNCEGQYDVVNEELSAVDYIYTSIPIEFIHTGYSIVLSLTNKEGKKAVYSSSEGKHGEYINDDISKAEGPYAILTQGDKKRFYYQYLNRRSEVSSEEYNNLIEVIKSKDSPLDTNTDYIIGIKDDEIVIYAYRTIDKSKIMTMQIICRCPKYDNIDIHQYKYRRDYINCETVYEIHTILVVEESNKKGIIKPNIDGSIETLIPIECDEIIIDEEKNNYIITRKGSEIKIYKYNRGLKEMPSINYKSVESIKNELFIGKTDNGYDIFIFDEENNSIEVLTAAKDIDEIKIVRGLIAIYKYGTTILYTTEEYKEIAKYPEIIDINEVKIDLNNQMRIEDWEVYSQFGLYEINGEYYLLNHSSLEKVELYVQSYEYDDGYLVVNSIDDRKFKKTCNDIELTPKEEIIKTLKRMRQNN